MSMRFVLGAAARVPSASGGASSWARAGRRGVGSMTAQVADYDLVVIGSGPSATQCAVESAKKGKRVAVVDKQGLVGGVCVHTGTIPSKTFREAVLHLSGYRHHGYDDASISDTAHPYLHHLLTSLLVPTGSTASRTR